LKLPPVSVTTVTPAVGPWLGVVAVTLPTAALLYVKWSAATAEEVPAGVITRMSTVPEACGGDWTVNCMSLLTTKLEDE
jgi:hypothetical protein